jgi:hypothetical protein
MAMKKAAARSIAKTATARTEKRSPRRPASKQAASGTHSQGLSHTTTDHDEIRNWAEQRGAQPACVKGTGGKSDVGMLRLDFPGYSEDSLQAIEWDDFFEKFDEQGLALVYQEKTAGGAVSNFNKLISRSESVKKGAAEKPKTRTAR